MNDDRVTNHLFNNKEFYQFFLLLQSLDDLKRTILMILAHIYPKEISTSELIQLLGYSKHSRYLYKSETLHALEVEKLITITKPSKNLTRLKLNDGNDLLKKFSNICASEGKALSGEFLGKLLE